MSLDDWRRSKDELEDAAVAALIELHRRRVQKTQRNAGRSEFERVVNHFERRTERLRGERIATEELVSRLLGGTRTLLRAYPQKELELHGPCGGVATTRLCIHNRARERQSYELTVGSRVDGPVEPEIRIEPRSGALDASTKCWLRLEVSLAGFESGSRITVPIQCHWTGGLERIWLTVHAEDDST
jgi:hypothetical protein